jgi:hypothetical protein
LQPVVRWLFELVARYSVVSYVKGIVLMVGVWIVLPTLVGLALLG